jgi:purine-binding chemotaxis protein CheW
MRSSDGPKNRYTSAGSAADQYHLVTFRLERQVYALPIEPIQQIIEMVTITPVPQVNHSVEGVINFRGRAVPVVNLRRHLGLPRLALKLHTPIILILFGEYLIGLIVDEVQNVITCATGDIVAPQDILPEGLGETPLLKGLLRAHEKVVLLLDVAHLFDLSHAQALVEAVTAIPAMNAEESAAPPAETARKSKRKSRPKQQQPPEPAPEPVA